jgi:hypothetical protein
MYTTQHLAWAYYERSKENKIFVLNQRNPSAVHDVVVTRKPFYKPEIHTNLKAIHKDSLTKNYILIQKEPFIREELIQKEVSFPWNANEFNDIITFEPNKNESYLFNIKGEIEIDSIYSDITIVFAGNNKKGEQVLYSYFPLRWYFGARNLKFEFEINQPVSFSENEVHSLKIYLWNPRHRSFNMEKSKMEVIQLK